jgi:hypothetical protein
MFQDRYTIILGVREQTLETGDQLFARGTGNGQVKIFSEDVVMEVDVLEPLQYVVIPPEAIREAGITDRMADVKA